MEPRFASSSRARPIRTGPGSSEVSFGFEHGFTRGVRVPIRRRRAPDFPLDLARRIRAFRPTVVLSAGLSPLVSGRVAESCRRGDRRRFLDGGDSRARRRGLAARYVLQRPHPRTCRFRHCLWLAERVVPPLAQARPPGRDRPKHGACAGRRRLQFVARPSRCLELVLIGDLADARKGVRVALEALQHSEVDALRLAVIGGGALLESLTAEAAADPRVRFLGPLAPGRRESEARRAPMFCCSRPGGSSSGWCSSKPWAPGWYPWCRPTRGAVADLTATGINAVVIDGHDPLDWAAAIDAIAGDARVAGAYGAARPHDDREPLVDLPCGRRDACRRRRRRRWHEVSDDPAERVADRAAAAADRRADRRCPAASRAHPEAAAERLGVSGMAGRPVGGGAVASDRYLPAIAEATSVDVGWLQDANSSPVAKQDDLELAGLSEDVIGRGLVLGAIVLLVDVRFFTEVVPVVPRAANFIDIPIFLGARGSGRSSSGDPGAAGSRSTCASALPRLPSSRSASCRRS